MNEKDLASLSIEELMSLPDEEVNLQSLSKDELDKIPFTKRKWVCCVKGCSRFSNVRDYGIAPIYYRPSDGWKQIGQGTEQRYLFCHAHWKWFNKLCKLYGENATWEKIVDFSKQMIVDTVAKVKRIRFK